MHIFVALGLVALDELMQPLQDLYGTPEKGMIPSTRGKNQSDLLVVSRLYIMNEMTVVPSFENFILPIRRVINKGCSLEE